MENQNAYVILIGKREMYIELPNHPIKASQLLNKQFFTSINLNHYYITKLYICDYSGGEIICNGGVIACPDNQCFARLKYSKDNYIYCTTNSGKVIRYNVQTRQIKGTFNPKGKEKMYYYNTGNTFYHEPHKRIGNKFDDPSIEYYDNEDKDGYYNKT